MANEEAKVTELIENKALLEGEDEKGFTPLMWAAWGDQATIAQLLLRAGADINHRNQYGWTALIEAADENAQETLKLLLRAGADLSQDVNRWNVTPLSIAASENHREVIELLIEAGAPLKGSRATHAAAEEGNLELLQYMIEQLGADINERDHRGRTPISYAAEEDKGAIVLYLLKAEADLSISDNRGQLPIDYAMSEYSESSLNAMISSMRAHEILLHQDLIFEASSNGNVELLRKLLVPGFDVNLRDNNGKTSLMEAVLAGEAGATKLLLEAGADVNATREGSNFSAFTMALQEEDPAIIKLLIDRGAHLEHTVRVKHVKMNTVEGKSVVDMSIYENMGGLMVAVRNESPETLDLLLNAGLDPNVTNTVKKYDLTREITKNDGSVEFDRLRAITRENTPHTKLVTTINGWTPLMEAAQMGKDELVERLLRSGADRARLTNTGLSAAEVARQAGHEELAKKLK